MTAGLTPGDAPLREIVLAATGIAEHPLVAIGPTDPGAALGPIRDQIEARGWTDQGVIPVVDAEVFSKGGTAR